MDGGRSETMSGGQAPQSKYAELLAIIEELRKDVRPSYAGNKSAMERLKRESTGYGPVDEAHPTIEHMCSGALLHEAAPIIRNPHQPGHSLLTAAIRYRSLRTCTTRFKNGYYPSTIRLMN
ncbi:uncharacterized protein LOC132407699 isoform X2 [Hypanus sabinus]|uniref:uncharacterized protein LOC132407699 isoform X2 n=1 Tax=Hypanus sabinus TaxID=79690 RepID=UPI0028C3E87D|nr:uncharacterized protein LOC132407699 isoform X2 [Hypanus sabinus]